MMIIAGSICGQTNTGWTSLENRLTTKTQRHGGKKEEGSRQKAVSRKPWVCCLLLSAFRLLPFSVPLWLIPENNLPLVIGNCSRASARE
jgi:hypothetical protein